MDGHKAMNGKLIDETIAWYRSNRKRWADAGIDVCLGLGPHTDNPLVSVEFTVNETYGAVLHLWEESGEVQFGGIDRDGSEFQEYHEVFDVALLDDVDSRVIDIATPPA